MVRRILRPWLGALLLTTVFAAAAPAETILFDMANPPFMYGAGGETATGLYPAVIGAVFSAMGEPAEMKAVPWKRAIAAIDQGEAGVGGIYKNEERLKKYDYSDKLFDEVITVYTQKGKEFEFTGVDALAGKQVGVLRGWSYGDAFDAAAKAGQLTADEAERDEQNFAKLAGGRIDVLLAVRESGEANMAKPEIAAAVVALPSPLSSSPSFLAFNKSAGKTETLARFNAAMAKMKADGTFDKLVKSSLSGN